MVYENLIEKIERYVANIKMDIQDLKDPEYSNVHYYLDSIVEELNNNL